MTPNCINRTDRKPDYTLHQAIDEGGGARIVLRSVTDDDGQHYTQQLNADGTWSEWHSGDWAGDHATAFRAPIAVWSPPATVPPVTVPGGYTITTVPTTVPLGGGGTALTGMPVTLTWESTTTGTTNS